MAILFVAALAVAFVPVAPATIDRSYSQGVYLVLHAGVTGASSLAPFALFDVAALAAMALLLAVLVRGWRARGAAAGLRAAGVSLVAIASLLYLVFVGVW